MNFIINYGKRNSSFLHRLAILFLSSFLSAAIPVQGFASHPLQRICQDQEKSDNYWVEAADVILIGEPVDVVSQIIPSEYNDGSCWAKFKVSEWLKGHGSKEIWIRSGINPYGVTDEERRNLKYCEFKMGKSFLIYGYTVNTSDDGLPSIWITTSSGLGSPPMEHCFPNLQLDNTNNQKINDIRNLINKGD